MAKGLPQNAQAGGLSAVACAPASPGDGIDGIGRAGYFSPDDGVNARAAEFMQYR